MNGLGRLEVREELCQVYGGPSPRKRSMWNESAPKGKAESVGSHRCAAQYGKSVQVKSAFNSGVSSLPSHRRAIKQRRNYSPMPETVQSSWNTAAHRRV